ncbi:MAG: SDR family oxidoreductase [Persicimonas sp.]
MAEKIVIIGAGYVGQELARQAVARGQEVVGTTRSSETAQTLEGLGAGALRWDVLDDPIEALAPQLDADTAVVYSIPTIYREYEAADGGLPRHVEPVERVLQACASRSVERFVYLSSTSVYGDHKGNWVDESTNLQPTSPYGKMRRDIEEHVLGYSKEFSVNIGRLVGIYGPGRTIADYVERGRYKLVDGGKKATNRIHVEDAARAVLAIIDRAPSGGRVYNLCDGDPRTVVELIDFLVERLGLERPEEISLQEYAGQRGPNVASRWRSTYRCDNKRLVGELGVELRYSNALEGYRAIFGWTDSEAEDDGDQ